MTINLGVAPPSPVGTVPTAKNERTRARDAARQQLLGQEPTLVEELGLDALAEETVARTAAERHTARVEACRQWIERAFARRLPKYADHQNERVHAGVSALFLLHSRAGRAGGSPYCPAPMGWAAHEHGSHGAWWAAAYEAALALVGHATVAVDRDGDLWIRRDTPDLTSAPDLTGDLAWIPARPSHDAPYLGRVLPTSPGWHRLPWGGWAHVPSEAAVCGLTQWYARDRAALARWARAEWTGTPLERALAALNSLDDEVGTSPWTALIAAAEPPFTPIKEAS